MAGLDVLATLLLGQLGAGTGWQQVKTPAAPAAGTGFSYTVPGDTWERPVGMSFKLVTSAAAGNRFPRLNFTDGDGSVFLSVPCSGGIAANGSVSYFANNQGFYSDSIEGGVSNFPLPDALLESGWKITITVDGEQAADQLSAVVLAVQRFATSAVRTFATG